MNKWVFGAVMFALMLNFATAILPTFLPGIDRVGTMGVSSQTNLTEPFLGFADTASNPESPMTDKGNLIYRLLDMINIGFIRAFSLIMNLGSVLYAFPKLMMGIIGPMMETEAQYNVIKTTLYGIFTIGYGLFILGLWSGRDLRDD